jgi:Family of unknown function (DUF6010)
MIEIGLFNYISPIVGGTIFILLTGFIPETHRRNFHAIVVAVAAGSYLGGILGKLEPLLTIIMATSAFLGLSHWQFIGLAWFLHGLVDLIHHVNSDPVFAWYLPSSFECIVVDWYFAIWFLFGAPNLSKMLLERWKKAKANPEA